MNRTAIEWTDFTWNPVTGCWGPGGTAEKPNRCSYCYAHRIAFRFCREDMGDDCTQPDAANHPFQRIHEIRYKRPGGAWRYAFAPTFHPYRLSEPAKVKKSSKIFVCSMADLFGDWIPNEWIGAVLNRVQRADYCHHIYQFLTKNPKRLKDFNPWPSNCWVGTTVTNQTDADERLPWLLQVDAPVRFVSHEPLLANINIQPSFLPGGPRTEFVEKCLSGKGFKCKEIFKKAIIEKRTKLNWAIIGAMTGPGAIRPRDEWVSDLIRQYRAAQVPVFLKDNLYPPGAPATVKFQEWPA